MASDINRIVITGRLTKDPELKTLQGGNAVCALRLAVNGRRKNGQSGEWQEAPNYFDVSVWGPQGANCAQYLSKGRQIAVDGRLRWREFGRQDGSKGQAVDIVADSVQFLGGQGENGGGAAVRTPRTDIPADTGGLETPGVHGGVNAGVSDDDIPF